MLVTLGMTDWFTRFTGGARELKLELQEGATTAMLLHAAAIPVEEVGFFTRVDASGQGETRIDEEKYRLQDGDTLRIYPLILGG